MINSRQYQTTKINVTTSGAPSTLIDCSTSNPANVNKLNVNPTAVSVTGGGYVAPTGTSTVYQCGAPKALTPSPTGSSLSCQNGIAGCICANGVSAGCSYSLGDITGNSPDNLLQIRYNIMTLFII